MSFAVNDRVFILTDRSWGEGHIEQLVPHDMWPSAWVRGDNNKVALVDLVVLSKLNSEKGL